MAGSPLHLIRIIVRSLGSESLFFIRLNKSLIDQINQVVWQSSIGLKLYCVIKLSSREQYSFAYYTMQVVLENAIDGVLFPGMQAK